MNFFGTKKEKKMPYRLDNSHSFKDDRIAISNMHPNDTRLQLSEWSTKQPSHRLLGLADSMQNRMIKEKSQVTLTTSQLDLIFRTISDLAKHLPEKTPNGVYDYNYHNIVGVSNNVLKQLDRQ